MRGLILVAGAAVAVAACGQNAAADNSVNAHEELAVQNITANDTTAIDAVTGDAANMAADVNFTINDFDNATEADNASGNNAT